eukprot:TRINITY_DN16442_c0_g1_i1.p1 TRINITY_DN16442_c0_g1~~TRINITY_DN16442_c0_g1_i1.p1  ORF type:complete len:122 (-),score=44.94 TRINITY_DN16442_c0_g1_i1:19-384(-)
MTGHTTTSAASLFAQAYEALKFEEKVKTTPAFKVTFTCLNASNSGSNYAVEVIVPPTGKVVNPNFFISYAHLALPSFVVENGFARTNKVAKFPLMGGFTRQVAVDGWLVTITVSDVLFESP